MTIVIHFTTFDLDLRVPAADNQPYSLFSKNADFAQGVTAQVKTETGPELQIAGIPFAKNAHPMWVFDRETLAFLEVNETAVRQYGYSRQEFLAMKIVDIRPEEDVPDLLRQTRFPRPAGASTGERWRHRTRDGKTFPVAITSWELTFHGRPAELVLARREQPA